MTVTELIDQLKKLEDRHGDLNVKFDNGVLVSDVDAYSTVGADKTPKEIVIK